MTMQQIVAPREIFVFEDETTYSRRIDLEYLADEEESIKEGLWSEDSRTIKGRWEAPEIYDPKHRVYGNIESFAQSDMGAMLIDEHGQVVTYIVT